MTKRELAQYIEEFVDAQDDTNKDEWYGTEKDFADAIMTNFKIWLNIDKFGRDRGEG